MLQIAGKFRKDDRSMQQVTVNYFKVGGTSVTSVRGDMSNNYIRAWSAKTRLLLLSSPLSHFLFGNLFF
jgi:hypothetical protein